MPIAPFIRAGLGVHPVVDFDALESYYPDIKSDVYNIGSASDLISWEQLRHWHGIEDPKAVPCDVLSGVRASRPISV
ncbi:hypothetical protein Pan54_36560 [Rubinisphaera italica]|uniref:Uncharacterized protein n=2 Tax=Rubinisphaera italica TaxID=2527969 RepID=A0A5C5XL83_9PLAN|nr:hypothetical protein Pan54_36560 [Rubinisphaera italica]